jgi:hypothetical protein
MMLPSTAPNEIPTGLGAIGALGSTAADNVPGLNNACGMSYLSYLTDWNCWGDSFANWQAAYNSQGVLTTLLGSGPGSGGTSGTTLDPCASSLGVSCPVLMIGALIAAYLAFKL